MDVYVFGVICEKVFQTVFHKILSVLREGAFHQFPYSVPDHCPVFLHPVLRQIPERQGVVHGASQVVDGIEQGAVQVEYDEIFHFFPNCPFIFFGCKDRLSLFISERIATFAVHFVALGHGSNLNN